MIAKSRLVSGFAGLLLAGAAFAQSNPAPAPAMGSREASGADQSFAKEAAVGGMSEVELGRLAVEKATDPRVRQFGQQMIDDHSKANDALKAAASKEGITLPTGTDAKHQKTMERLQKLSGSQFDAAYTEEMLRDHKEDVAAFEKEARAGSSAVQKFAADTLPTLQNHLQMIEAIHGSSSKPGR